MSSNLARILQGRGNKSEKEKRKEKAGTREWMIGNQPNKIRVRQEQRGEAEKEETVSEVIKCERRGEPCVSHPEIHVDHKKQKH